MTATASSQTWQSVRAEVLQRITEKTWLPGDAIPNEADLAKELGCARATVNRALRSLSDDGLLERRRKGGTRVARHRVGRATIEIPILRIEIEERGLAYGYRLLERRSEPAPAEVGTALGISGGEDLLHVVSLHLAGGRPYALEDRWIVPETVPDALDEGFGDISANEWLLLHLPFTRAESDFSAINASAMEAATLGGAVGDALMVHRRMTWLADQAITLVEITFAKGHKIRSQM